MLRKSTAILLAAAVLLAFAAAAYPKDDRVPVDEAYKNMIEKRRGYESMADRLAVTKDFLEKYPDSKYTARLITHVYYYQGDQLDDPAGAVAYAEQLRARVKTPEFITDFDKSLVEIYGEAGMIDKMIAVADRLEAASELDFGDYWNIVDAAAANDAWKLVRTYCAKARPLANAKAYRAEYPDREMTDQEIEKAGANRAAMLAGMDAWALANLGQIGEALAEFETAGQNINRSYVGVLDYDIGLHWGKTLMMKGDYHAAIERFAPQALIMGNDDALAGLTEAYEKKTGGEDGFDAYIERLHREIAPKVTEFELPLYDGKRVKYADIKGEVTLLAFWFPT
jgi:tetratricopeptide (TPR) repeat protein